MEAGSTQTLASFYQFTRRHIRIRSGLQALNPFVCFISELVIVFIFFTLCFQLFPFRFFLCNKFEEALKLVQSALAFVSLRQFSAYVILITAPRCVCERNLLPGFVPLFPPQRKIFLEDTISRRRSAFRTANSMEQSLSYSRSSSHFIETECSLSCSQEPVIGLCQPDQSTPRHGLC
jgi:hypothetical protein